MPCGAGACAVDDLDYVRCGDIVRFSASGHEYQVQRASRGRPSVTLLRDGMILARDRVDLNSTKSRADFAKVIRQQGDTEAIVAELLALAHILDADGTDDQSEATDHSPLYEATDEGIIWHKRIGDRTIPIPVADFAAYIVEEIVEDDGAEQRTLFMLEAEVAGVTKAVTVAAEAFGRMTWVVTLIGALATIYAGMAEHMRAAIQTLSRARGVAQTRVYTHIGWRRLEVGWSYLHAGGALGADGSVEGIAVRLAGRLQPFALPIPPEGLDLQLAVHASLRFFGLAPDTVTMPLYAALWRAPLAPARFAIHLVGQTGEGKSEVSAFIQQHWGAGLHARNLPGSWSSTDNALEDLLFAAADAIVVVDDFAPGATQGDMTALYHKAERIFRNQGNGAGKQRLRADLTPRPAKPPRGLLFSTGEVTPQGHSVRGRMLEVELPAGVLDWAQLTRCQEDAANGLLAQAMAAYLLWLAPHMDEVRSGLAREVAELRSQATQEGQHRRTPELVAELGVGLQVFLTFVVEVGALTQKEAAQLWGRGWAALGEVAAAQVEHQAENEPAQRYLRLLAAAITSGAAHVADETGEAPAGWERWGWNEVQIGSGGYLRAERRSRGDRIGWVEGDDLYLEPDASYRVAFSFARQSGGTIGVSAQTLRKRLHERGLLASTETTNGQRSILVRRVLGGEKRRVLHLHVSMFYPQ